MSKTISAALLADIQSNVTTLATLIEIKNQSGGVVRLTSHDADIVYLNSTYSHDVPFIIGAISHGSQLAVDNCSVDLYTDEILVKRTDFQAGVFDQAAITISLVDYETPADGAVVIQEGWIGKIDLNEERVIKLEIYGLLKVLDYKIGRVYQASCDADLGDKRCRIAIDYGQALSSQQKYGVGDWVYAYDEAQLTTIAVANPSFEANGVAVNGSNPITSWTRSSNSDLEVKTSITGILPTLGTYLLSGGTEAPATYKEQFLTQDIDIGTAITTAVIDAGTAILLFRADGIQAPGTSSNPSISVDILDATGKIIDHHDTHFVDFNDTSKWRPLSLGFPLIQGARTARLFLNFFRGNKTETEAAIDNVRLSFWNTATGNPHDSVIHKVSRVISGDNITTVAPLNASFDANSPAVVNSDAADIDNWTKPAGNFWKTGGSLGALNKTSGSFMLQAGDDASGVQKTYEISQAVDIDATGWNLDTTRIDLSKFTGRFVFDTMFADTVSAGAVKLEFLNSSLVVIRTDTALATTISGTVQVLNTEYNFTLPPLTRKIRVTLSATSPVGSSQPLIGFDTLSFRMFDSEIPVKGDALFGVPKAGTTYNRTVGSLTIDGGLVMKAHTPHVQNDVVATVISKKEFTGTSITGADGAFTGSKIKWITGNNVGRTNLIRLWTTGTKTVKTYFNSIQTIQVGDRFEYVLTCNKRFQEDCVIQFDNGINFRGFPHLPGKVSNN